MNDVVNAVQENLLALIGTIVGGGFLSYAGLKFMAKSMIGIVVNVFYKVLFKKTGLTKEDIHTNLPGLVKMLTQFGSAYKEKIDFIFETLALSLPNKIESPAYDEAQTARLQELEARAIELGATKVEQMTPDIDPELAKQVLEFIGKVSNTGGVNNENR